jgi:hypothetical protein
MPATAATRAPSGAVSVPLPRTPSENMRSNTVVVVVRYKTLRTASGGLGRTCGDERLGGRLAREMGERERRADAFERAEVSEDHRGLAGPEAEYGVVRLAPFFVEQACAAGRVQARWALPSGYT